MRRSARIFLLLAAALLSGACGRKTLDADQTGVYIYLSIQVPELTKADIGSAPADLVAENTIHDLQIWIFRHSDGLPLGYLRPTSANNDESQYYDPLTNLENKYFIPLTPAIAEAHPTVDVYALGNAQTLSLGTLGPTTSREDLDALLISGEAFGLMQTEKTVNNNPVQVYTPACTSVPATGLPFSGVGKELQMKGDYPVMSIDVVTLRRAVSKFRFIFCQLEDEVGPMIDDFTISELVLDGGDSLAPGYEPEWALPKQEFLFNTSNARYRINDDEATGGGYVAQDIDFTPPEYGDVASNPAPEDYIYTPGQSAASYEAQLQQGLAAGVLTEWGRCYLRESDRPLKGHMIYSISNGETKTARFQMADPGDFARGHSWVVYIYFLRDAMQFDVFYTAWYQGDENEYNLTEG